MAFRAVITWTATPNPRTEPYRTLGTDALSAREFKELHALLADKYGRSWHHRRGCFRDLTGGTIQTGWVVGFRTNTVTQNPKRWGWEQDWIEVYQVQPADVKRLARRAA